MGRLLDGREVVTAIPGPLLCVEGDPVLLGQVLANLLENVAKHTPPGTALRIEAGISREGVRISVIDDGPGLPPGAVATLFTPFERDTALTGGGLGLAICRVIARAHGGDVAAESVPVGGAAFTLLLPAGTAPPRPAEPA